MTRVKTFTQLRIIITMVIVLALLPLYGQQAYASYTYSFNDTSTSTQPKGGGTKIFEDYMVWHQNDSEGHRQIYYKNLLMNVDKQVTHVSSTKEAPNLGITSQEQPVIIWTDKRNYNDLDPIWDIYSYNTVTEVEKKLNSAQGQFVSPSIDGDYVVWHVLTTRDMYVYDLVNGEETFIGKGRYPVVAKGKVLYQNPNDGGLSLYNIETMETKKVVELPYHEFVFAFTFNGETALWGKTDFDHVATYSMANTAASEMTIKNLTTPKKQELQYPDLILGENFGAWLEQRNGVTQIVGADLLNTQTYQITHSTTNQKLYSFYGDRLILKGENGNLLYRNIIAVPSSGGSIQPIPDKALNSTRQRIGLEGDLVEIKNQIQVHIPKGTFDKESLVSIQEKNVQGDHNKSLITPPWEINSELPFTKDAKLVIHVAFTQIIPQQLKKLAIYFYNEETSSWEYSGGVVNQTTQTITTHIKQPGTYAVMLYEKTFTDIQKHWAQDHIETLASRLIINVIDDPDGTYTIKVDLEEEFSRWAKEGTVEVLNPNPPAPKNLEILPNRTSDSHIIRGIAEKGTKVTLEISYTKREGYEQVPGETITIENIPVSNGMSWSREREDIDIDASYFTDFPLRADNQPEDYIGEWQVKVELNAYEIAHVTATTERIMDGKQSGVSEALRVLRFKAPTYNVTWEALAGYYYRAWNVDEMVAGAEKIAEDNEVDNVCNEARTCPGTILKGTNLLIMDPLLAGAIQEEELEELTAEKIANRFNHPTPKWWDYLP